MKVGTKSVLFGYHCFFLHPLFVAYAWLRMHGFRRVKIGERRYANAPASWKRAVHTSILDYKLWWAFCLHDIGYWGKPNMDGPEGERHPEMGARIMRRKFGEPWGELCLYHSRFYARRDQREPSALCFPDKTAYLYYPTWLIVWLCSWTGEINEYMQNAHRDNAGIVVADGVKSEDYFAPNAFSKREWAEGVKTFIRQWVAKHQDGTPDTVTVVRDHA